MDYTFTSKQDVLDAALRFQAEKLQSRGELTPQVAKDYLRLKIGALPHEEFWVLFVDNRSHWIGERMIGRGDSTMVISGPREIVKTAIELGASAVVVAHNHPGGVARPSKEDIEATKKIVEALDLFKIQLLDAYVVTASEVMSIADYAADQVIGELKDKVGGLIAKARAEGKLDELIPPAVRAKMKQMGVDLESAEITAEDGGLMIVGDRPKIDPKKLN